MSRILRQNFLSLVLFVSIFTSCGDNDEAEDCREQPDVSRIDLTVDIERLDKQLFEAENPDEIGKIMRQNPVMASYYLPDPNMINELTALSSIYDMTKDKSLDTLYQETSKVFGDMSDLEGEFTKAFKNFAYYIPSFKKPEVKTMVTGLAGFADLYVSDSILLVGIDYFQGPEASFRPANTPEYLLRRYTPEHIVPSAILFLSQSYNAADASNTTLLSDMIYYGKSYYLVSRTIPCLADSTMLGYTSKEAEGVAFNREQIWKHFIDNNLLYETNHFIKTKYTGERPKTFEISNDAPGRIGVWLGLDIVRQYMAKNPDVSVEELMRNANAQEIFEKSHYRPERD